MSTTSQTTGFTGIVNQQQKLDNSEANAPGVPQQQKFENKAFGTTDLPTHQQQQQQQQQQPGYLQQAYDGVANLVSSALPGNTGVTSTGTGTGIAAPQPLHAAAQRVKQQHGPTGGVGSLPGTPNEADVVRLPEERQHPDPLAEERERMGQRPLGSQLDDPTRRSSLTADTGTHPHTTGGSAIGSNFDHHHGLGMEHKQADVGRTGIAPHPGQPGFGASTTTHNSSTTHPSSGFRDTSGEHHVTDTAGVLPRSGAPGAGATTATHGVGTAATRPAEAVRETAHKVTGDRDRDPSHTHPTDHREGELSSSSPTDPSHKPTMMEKMKGQAKILTGKMTKDAEKVEEGRALKSAQ